MWPTEGGETQAGKDNDSDEDEDEEEDIEKQIAKEMSGMKRPKKETRFGMSLLILASAGGSRFAQRAARLIPHVVRALAFLLVQRNAQLSVQLSRYRANSLSTR